MTTKSFDIMRTGCPDILKIQLYFNKNNMLCYEKKTSQTRRDLKAFSFRNGWTIQPISVGKKPILFDIKLNSVNYSVLLMTLFLLL